MRVAYVASHPLAKQGLTGVSPTFQAGFTIKPKNPSKSPDRKSCTKNHQPSGHPPNPPPFHGPQAVLMADQIFNRCGAVPGILDALIVQGDASEASESLSKAKARGAR